MTIMQEEIFHSMIWGLGLCLKHISDLKVMFIKRYSQEGKGVRRKKFSLFYCIKLNK